MTDETASTPFAVVDVDTKRKRLLYQGRPIYDWEQSLTDIEVFITPPPGCTAKFIDVDIKSSHLRIGVKGNPPYIDLDLFSTIKISDSTWTFESSAAASEIRITLAKCVKAEVWPAVFIDHATALGGGTFLQQENARKQLMLERFQEENPGFDFSNATFSGAAPDPREFMGGVKSYR